MYAPTCFLCTLDGGDGSGRIHVPGYLFDVCETHWSLSRDGWDVQYEDAIIEHLKRLKIEPPARNQNGFLPRQFFPPHLPDPDYIPNRWTL